VLQPDRAARAALPVRRGLAADAERDEVGLALAAGRASDVQVADRGRWTGSLHADPECLDLSRTLSCR
jgi:hypothetical protein